MMWQFQPLLEWCLTPSGSNLIFAALSLLAAMGAPGRQIAVVTVLAHIGLAVMQM